MTDTLRLAAFNAIEAFRLTREYVGEDVLPAIPGWSWYDATMSLQEALCEPQSDLEDENRRLREHIEYMHQVGHWVALP